MKKALVLILLVTSGLFAQEPYRILNSFNAGYLGPELLTREDLSVYQSGCATMENVIPLPQGGIQKRPGTKYVATAKDALAIRLFPFQYSTSQSYIIEAGNQYMRFFTNNAAVTLGSGTESSTTIDASGTVVGQWNLNDNIDGDSNVVDRTGVNDMTLAGSIASSTAHADGKVGTGCFDFTTTYAAEVADGVSFSFTDNTNDEPFSITSWVYVTATDAVQNIMSKWKEDTDREWRFSLDANKKLQFHLADENDFITVLSQWKMNDAVPSTVVIDSEGLQNGVCSVNTDTIDATGKISGALNLGGTASVFVTDIDSYSFTDNSNDSDFSVGAWVYLPVTGDGLQEHIISKWDDQEKLEWAFYKSTSDKLTFALHDESIAKSAVRRVDNAITVGWHFVVATYDGDGLGSVAADRITIYVDGTAVDSTAETEVGYVAMENKTGSVTIGCMVETGSSARFWPDKIDNVFVAASTLSASKVLNLYNSGNGTESFFASFPNIVSDDALEDGWRFVCATYSAPADETAAAGGMELYVDGVAVSGTATNVSSYTAMQDGSTSMRIGAQENSAAALQHIFADKIDVTTLYKDELSAADVATLYSSTTPYEIETPYLTADLFDLKYEQSADVLYIVHPEYETRKLSRNSETDWSLTAFDAQAGPFKSQNTTVTKTIASSATTGTVTLTAVGHSPFVSGTTAGHLPSGTGATSMSQTGALFKFSHPFGEPDFVGTFTAANDYLDCGTIFKDGGWNITTEGNWRGTVLVQRNYTIGAAWNATGWETVYTCKSGTASGAGTEKNFASATRTEDDEDADYQVIYTVDWGGEVEIFFETDQTEVIGVVEITAVTSPTVATGTVIRTLGSTDATYKWSEGSWSNYRGWPQTVAFFEDRLVFGGNTSQPDTVWGSVTGDYENMLAGAEDSDAVVFTLTSRKVNAIEWIIGKDKILIGTSGAEWTLAGSSDEPLTPSNVKAEQHSTYGSANLQATLANESVLFFQRGAERMRELAYNWESDSYVAPDMTIIAKDITGDGITNTAYQQIPDAILWCVKENGDIATFSYERKEKVTAWSKMITDGDFESVAIIDGSAEDEVWVSVQRDINSNTTARYIEYFSARDFGDDIDDAYFVDSGITYDSTAITSLTGLDHLEGETVSILGDGAIDTSAAVSGGIVAVVEAETIQAGLPYTVQVKTMPLSWLGGPTIHGRQKRISEVITSWYLSGDFSVGKDATKLQTYSLDGMTTSEDRITFPPGWDRYGQVFMYQLSPEPLTILGVMLTFEVE